MRDDGGQLLNDRNEFNIQKDDFCEHLLRGQAILKRSGRYAAYRKADEPKFLNGHSCYHLGRW